MTGSGVKRALLIGIDTYPYVRPLDGCVNDVALMAAVLQEPFGFAPGNITRLTNDQATRDAILSALDALVERTGRDDIVVIQYAGHGSQMQDREGDESSGWDNTIMPFDCHRGQLANRDYRDITDDEIHLRLQALAKKTSFITLIFDSCHSGTITRDAFGVESRGIERDSRAVDQLPPSPIPSDARAAKAPGPSGWMPLSDSYVLMAGCHDNETSYEYQAEESGGYTPHGALTYFLCAELRQAIPGTTYRDVFERAAAKVTATYATQHPQLEGKIDREVFGVRDVEPVRYVRVLQRSGKSVTLAAGAALGMTKGSRWSVYAQGTKKTPEATPLGELEITAVEAVTATARIVSESAADSIGAYARAVETVHAYGDFRLSVQLVGEPGDSALAVMKELLGKSPLLRVVDTSTPAAARVYLVPPRESAGPDDPAPQLGAIADASWVAIGETGQLLGPPKRRGAEDAVRRNLETVARYRQALALENPDPSSVLRDKVKFELLRQAGDGQWEVAVPNTAGGQVVFSEGEQVAFRVTNDHADPVYISILDFSLSGDIGVLYPPPGAKEKVNPGITFEIGSDPSRQKIRLAAEQHAITDVETFKLVATSDATDFSFLQQEGVRDGSRGQTPLSLLWETATGTRATRATVTEQPVVAESWATVVRPFVLRARTSAPEPGHTR